MKYLIIGLGLLAGMASANRAAAQSYPWSCYPYTHPCGYYQCCADPTFSPTSLNQTKPAPTLADDPDGDDWTCGPCMANEGSDTEYQECTDGVRETTRACN